MKKATLKTSDGKEIEAKVTKGTMGRKFKYGVTFYTFAILF